VSSSKRHEGIEIRHDRNCATRRGARCSCSPSFRAKVYDGRTGRYLKKTFSSVSEAKAWRTEALVALRQGTITAALAPTLAEAGEAWITGAKSGAIRNRSGDVYKPSAVRGYAQALRLRVVAELGHLRLTEIRRGDLQAFVDRMLAAGHEPSTIRNTLLPVRAIYRRALARGEVAVNPTLGLELPAVRNRRERIASPGEASRLRTALPRDRALWATAMYAGLRPGELLALEWSAVDFERGLIHVRRSWDPKAGPIKPKSRAGRRSVPLAQILRGYMAEHRLACPWSDGLVFGRTPKVPFLAKTPGDRARRVWMEAGLTPIGLHECRHRWPERPAIPPPSNRATFALT